MADHFSQEVLTERIIICILLLTGLSILDGCGEKIDPVQVYGDCNEAVTYTDQIKAIFDTHCIACHTSDKQGAARNGAPDGVDFNTYIAAINHADHANGRIQAETMPLPGFGIPAVPAAGKRLFQCWIDQGKKE